MPYDRNLDECLFVQNYETDAERITVSVYSYNNGPKKLQITRENKDAQGNFRFTKLGRVTKEEITSILPLINEAITKM
ncbi:MAG: hypothetical protein PHP69_00025 [Candidatus Omnitrophica bacterium]|nr:hypothetical protein [Candidatus Omnitrophota bacterium]MDD5081501.1 hypothetical protein [Candidatus Omnitrophota bacterium]MDD5441131.1 hypothetical protein [Candidatus Omnitrophota bacterium]